MGVLNTSKDQALLAREFGNAQDKWKKKGKDNKKDDSNSKDKHKPSDGASGSKKHKNKKFEKAQCSYCMREFHPEIHCMKKTIDQMEKTP